MSQREGPTDFISPPSIPHSYTYQTESTPQSDMSQREEPTDSVSSPPSILYSCVYQTELSLTNRHFPANRPIEYVLTLTTLHFPIYQTELIYPRNLQHFSTRAIQYVRSLIIIYTRIGNQQNLSMTTPYYLPYYTRAHQSRSSRYHCTHTSIRLHKKIPMTLHHEYQLTISRQR